jgi:precorrin-3B synthase
MQSGDGLIVRLRLGTAGLQATQLRAVAQLAAEHGNGQIEATRRANLQLRGVRPAALSTLQAALLRLGLGSPTADGELSNALLVNPLAGLDAGCAGLPAVALEIERVLSSFERAASLPTKFAIVLDAAGECALLNHLRADVRIALCTTEPALCQLSASAADGTRLALGACSVRDVAAVVRRLIAALADFNERAADSNARMSDLLARDGCSLLVDGGSPVAEGGSRVAVALAQPRSLIGFHAALRSWFGIGVPFGSADAEHWQAIATLCEQFGDGTLRVAPTRSVLLLGARAADSARLAAAAREHGLLVEPGDPLLRVVACPGAPACSSACGETRELARTLSAVIQPALASLHVSGCAKSCASSGASDITVVHAADGCKLGFGLSAAETALLSSLPIEAVRHWLATHHSRANVRLAGETATFPR